MIGHSFILPIKYKSLILVNLKGSEFLSGMNLVAFVDIKTMAMSTEARFMGISNGYLLTECVLATYQVSVLN